MRQPLIYLALGLLVCAFSGCATLFTGYEDEIYFISKPEGAKVYINGLEICTTPCSVDIHRSLGKKVGKIELEGYKTRVFQLSTDFNLVSILNLNNPVGWVVDLVSGSIVKHDQLVYYFDFTQAPDATAYKPFRVDIDTDEKQLDLFYMPVSR